MFQNIRFTNSYASLGPDFGTPVQAMPLHHPRLVHANASLLAQMGLAFDPQQPQELVDFINAAVLPPQARPFACLYAGHQFGVWVPQLGDGRAISLCEIEGQDGQLWDLQTKGSGLTPYSRNGDGRAVLRSSIREYLCAEAMAGLGIASTRSIGLITSDDPVYREQVERAAIVMRASQSFVRFGSFEVFASRGQTLQLQQLADYVISRFYPHVQDQEQPYAALLAEVVIKTAELMADWMAVGFSHGVMNTDNMSILGYTLDYGPFGFMDAYDPAYICNHSDYQGRYAFYNQPNIGFWNVQALAHAFAPLIDDQEAIQQALNAYAPTFNQRYLHLMGCKLGIGDAGLDDFELVKDFLVLITGQDFTNSFRRLMAFDGTLESVRDEFIRRDELSSWLGRYEQRLHGTSQQQRLDLMARSNPKYILRNYLAQQAIDQAGQGDFSEVDKLMRILAKPFDEQPEYEAYAADSPDWARGIQLSCSS